jgi:peptide/nickel transport system substrate-binding protein
MGRASGLSIRRAALACWAYFTVVSGACAAEPQYAIAMHGQPKHAAGFAHYDAVKPDAPKGGRLVQGVLGSFDSTNPYIIKGVPADGVVAGNVTESLMSRSMDEPFTLYGLLAESLEVPPDRSEVTFNLNPDARFSDGHPVTADDVLFSLNVLREKGRPNHRYFYKKVFKTERLGERRVRFVFEAGSGAELPLILGLMPILPSHLMSAETFETTSLEPFVGSGPYTMSHIDAGRSITLTRDPNYWGRGLPAQRGRYNFDELRYEYYRDDTAMFEAFKAGGLDVRLEDSAVNWFQGYDFPAVKDGRIVRAELESRQPASMGGFVFNTRRPVFADARVRHALVQMFDFEFANKTLFNGLYKRTQSFFERSYLSSFGRTADPEERRLLAPFPGAVRPDIMDGTAMLPKTDGSGRNRENLGKAMELLKAAGFQQVNGKLVEIATGRPLTFEVLVSSAGQQRVLLGFKADLERIGIAMVQHAWLPASLSPGNEQTFRWSEKAEGSFNYAGVASPAADAMIKAMVEATEPEAFVSAVRALDRVLRSGDYVIPLHYVPGDWLAHAARIHIPAPEPMTGLSVDTWWSESK